MRRIGRWTDDGLTDRKSGQLVMLKWHLGVEIVLFSGIIVEGRDPRKGLGNIYLL